MREVMPRNVLGQFNGVCNRSRAAEELRYRPMIVGHTDYQTTANIYTHVRDEMLKKSTVNMGDVFRKREE